MVASEITVARERNNAWAHCFHALLLGNVGSPDEADTAFQRAVRLAPTDANIVGNYAFFLENVRGEHDRAQQFYARALDADPDHANNLGNYARLHLEQGHDAVAIEMIVRAFDHAEADARGHGAGSRSRRR